MTPVKLSRERWALLLSTERGMPVPDKVELVQAEEIGGIVFLPAEYVPEDRLPRISAALHSLASQEHTKFVRLLQTDMGRA